MSKEWNIAVDGKGLSSEAIIENIMHCRGIQDVESFLNPSIKDLIELDKLFNVDRAYDIIMSTLKNKGRFLIYADVDLDGCSSAAIVYRYLKNYTDKLELHINKNKEHGISKDFDFSLIDDCQTIIIVDSINDNTIMYNKILSMGKELIIMDHHVPDQKIIDADFCLVSSSVNYPNPHLSGSGVTWKVAKYIDIRTGNNYADSLVDLAATGIIGDVCEVGENSMENRYICSEGLKNINNPALKCIVGEYEFTATTISYSIAPLINAANRTGHNKEALNVFIEDDPLKVSMMIEELKSYKEYQKSEIKRIYESVIIPQFEKQKDNKCLYFLNEDNTVFNGVVAGKAADEYCRPVMVLSSSPDGKYFSGSMRSVGVNNFMKIINDSNHASCRGHEMSAGVNIETEKFFVVYNYIEEQLKDYQFIQKIDVDIELTQYQLSESLITQLKQINKICGKGFKPILVCIKDISEYKTFKMSNGKHMNIKTDTDLSMIKWNISESDNVPYNRSVSVIGTVDLNEFRGKINRQLIINDYKIK